MGILGVDGGLVIALRRLGVFKKGVLVNSKNGK